MLLKKKNSFFFTSIFLLLLCVWIRFQSTVVKYNPKFSKPRGGGFNDGKWPNGAQRVAANASKTGYVMFAILQIVLCAWVLVRNIIIARQQQQQQEHNNTLADSLMNSLLSPTQQKISMLPEESICHVIAYGIWFLLKLVTFIAIVAWHNASSKIVTIVPKRFVWSSAYLHQQYSVTSWCLFFIIVDIVAGFSIPYLQHKIRQAATEDMRQTETFDYNTSQDVVI